MSDKWKLLSSGMKCCVSSISLSTIAMPGMRPLARGTQVRVDLIRWDEIDLSVEARLLDVTENVDETASDENEEELTE